MCVCVDRRGMGLPQEEPTTLFVDNKGAVELSRDRKSCHRSRHVDRRFFKVRELVFAGAIKVEYVPTEDNPADILISRLSTAIRVPCCLPLRLRFAPWVADTRKRRSRGG